MKIQYDYFFKNSQALSKLHESLNDWTKIERFPVIRFKKNAMMNVVDIRVYYTSVEAYFYVFNDFPMEIDNSIQN